MDQLLIPDLSATIDVDPVALGPDPDPEKVGKILLKVGYIKPAKFAEIRSRLSKVTKKHKEDPEAGYEEYCDVYRDICRWGLKGWNLDIPWQAEEETVRGRKVAVAAEATIEALEIRGWLPGLALEVLSFNTLQDDSKKK